jgi:hypothetical protein
MKTVTNRGSAIGVIGLGDLGSRLVAQILLSGNKVIAFDRSNSVQAFKQAVDPTLSVGSLSHIIQSATSMGEVLSKCQIVHWAIPSNKLGDLPLVSDSCIVVLHDSVMDNSVLALRERPDKSRLVIAHCLMNDDARVLVSNEFGNYKAVHKHLREVGLAPRYITTSEHDTMMARTQGIFALLIKLGIREELDLRFTAGDLTPSAIELRAAVTNREANWTRQTLQSILTNPKLAPFVKEMSDVLVNNGDKHIIKN